MKDKFVLGDIVIIEVSTTFTNSGWETMIFREDGKIIKGGRKYRRGYGSSEEAAIGHSDIVNMIQIIASLLTISNENARAILVEIIDRAFAASS